MSRFVIAGATGRVGSVVAHQLLAAGYAVTIVTRSAERGAPLATLGAHVTVGTLGNAKYLATVLDDAAPFFTLLPEPLDAVDFHGERRRVADAIADAVSRCRVPHVVALSSVGAHFADGMGPINDLHYLETVLRGSGTKLTALRASTFQDNIAAVLEPATASGIFPNLQPGRDVPLPMVATRDVGVIAAQVLSHAPSKNEVVDILGPSYTPRQVAATLGQALGRSLEIIDIPPSEHVAALTRGGLPFPFAQAVAELQSAIAAGRIMPVGDRRETGSTTLERTLTGILRGAASAPAA
jgi:uncharacterized protein YbjT (DUF2867 family)